MSQYQRTVCELILEESFGEIVKEVGSHLLRHGGQKLSDLVKELKLQKPQVVKALIVLIQHSLVAYTPHRSAFIYHVVTDNVLCRSLFPQYIHTGRELFGDIGGAIIEDLIINGQSCMSQALARVVMKLNGDSDKEGAVHEKKLLETVKEHFVNLVDARLLQRVATPSTELGVIPHTHSVPAPERYLVPVELGVSEIIAASRGRKRGRTSPESELPVSKKLKSTTDEAIDDSPPDAAVLWYIDFKEYQRHYRDKAIVDGVSLRIDPIAASIMKCLLSLSSSSPSDSDSLNSTVGPEVFLPQLKDSLPQGLSLTDSDLEQYLMVLAEDEFIERVRDGGGGSICVNFKKSSEMLCQSQLELIVRERFDDRHLRLFRLLCLKKRLEQKQISDMALIPSKKAKEVLYSLLAEHFVTLQEVPRSSDYAISRTFHLFSVELHTVTRVVLQRCYKALGNLMICRKEEGIKNKRLLEKYKLWERQQKAFQQQQREEDEEQEDIEEVLTPVEREMTETIMKRIEKLEASELQLMESLLTLEDYLRFVS